MSDGIWEPRRLPLVAQALSGLPAGAREDFERGFETPTDVQRHLWLAAARRESVVVVSPRKSGGRFGLEIASQVLGGTVVETRRRGVRSLELRTAHATLVVVEPSKASRGYAVSLASEFGRCGFVDVVPYPAIRARVFAPFRDEPHPDTDAVNSRWSAELRRMAEGGRQIAVANGAAEPPAGQLAEYAFADGWKNSAIVIRAAAMTDGPFHERPAVVLFATDWRSTLDAYVVASRVRAGEFDDEGAGETESERVSAEWASRVRTSTDSEEREAYRLVASLAMNRGNAIAVVRGARG